MVTQKAIECTVNVISPRKNDRRELKSEKDITWRYQCSYPKLRVKIHLMQDKDTWVISDDEPNSGTYNWKAGSYKEGRKIKYVSTGNYEIKISIESDDNLICEDTSETFEIVKPKLT